MTPSFELPSSVPNTRLIRGTQECRFNVNNKLKGVFWIRPAKLDQWDSYLEESLYPLVTEWPVSRSVVPIRLLPSLLSIRGQFWNKFKVVCLIALNPFPKTDPAVWLEGQPHRSIVEPLESRPTPASPSAEGLNRFLG